MAVVVVAVLLTALTACVGEEPDPPDVSDKADQGGTVRVLTKQDDFDTLDPQRIYVTTEANVSGLITRPLTGYAKGKGGKSGELVGDLATDAGDPSKDSKVWKFTLREDVKWQTGEIISCEDVKYGVLRAFDVRAKDAVITGGPQYPTQWIDVPKDYEGPRKDGVDVDGVNCLNDRTIEFKLKESVPEFANATTLPAFAPVPSEQDTWADYGTEPISSGPYKLAKYQPAEEDEQGSAVFTRNRYWDSDTDQLREAKPEKIEVELGVDPDRATEQILTEDPGYEDAVLYEGVPDRYTSQVMNEPELEDQLVSGPAEDTVYMSVNTEKVSRLECRQALEYAFDKRKFLDVYGGEAHGDYASTVLPPHDPAHRDFDVYADSPDGDLDKAGELMDEAGDCPTKLTLDIPKGERGEKLGETIQQTYGRLDISVKLNKIEANDFYRQLSDPDKISDLSVAVWVPDWPGGSGMIPPMFDGDLIKKGVNSNFSLLDDSDINDRIDAARDERDPDKAKRMWADIDEQVVEQAAVVPIMHSKVLTLCGSKVRGGHLNAQWGAVDLTRLGVASGK